MDLFEKANKLREKANVSFEDAKAALEEANGDMLDAMIILEKQGKTSAPENETYSTNYEDNKQLPIEVEAVEGEEMNDKKNKGENEFVRKLKALWKKSCDNFLIIERKEERILKLPLWLFVLLVIIGIHVVPILMVISLFFGCHYSFKGVDEMKTANSVMNKADEAAQYVKDEFNKL